MKRVPLPKVDHLKRTTCVHRHPCARCPSAHHPPDPEAQDMLQWPREQQVANAFLCGWRPNKLCRGYVDRIAATREELEAHLPRD